MKHLKFLCLFTFSVALNGLAQSSMEKINFLAIDKNTEKKVIGHLDKGELIEDLSWAWNSSVACFIEKEAEHFNGNHVFYALDLPEYSELEIELIPDDKSHEMSIYAYQVGQISKEDLVPQLARCVRCEADYKRDRKVRGKQQNHTRSISDILATTKGYQVMIAVAGSDGLQAGAFTLKIKMKSR